LRFSQRQDFTCCFTPGFFLDPEDGGDMFLRNVGLLSTDYMALYARGENPSGVYSMSAEPARWVLAIYTQTYLLIQHLAYNWLLYRHLTLNGASVASSQLKLKEKQITKKKEQIFCVFRNDIYYATDTNITHFNYRNCLKGNAFLLRPLQIIRGKLVVVTKTKLIVYKTQKSD
jgi:hypothetical protein